MLSISCKCGAALDLPEGLIGEPVNCPSCGSMLRMVAGNDARSTGQHPFPLVSVRTGPARIGELFVLTGDAPIEVGKLPDRPVSLDGSRVSRSHCRFMFTGDRWHIEDNRSTNGLFVNGRRVTSSRALDHGDILTVGDFELEFHDPGLIAEAKSAQDSGIIDLESVEEAYDLAEEPVAPRVTVHAEKPAQTPIVKLAADAVSCPSCGSRYPKSTKICVSCGIDLKSGRSILMSSDLDEDALYVHTESIIRLVSWIVPSNLIPLPIASDSYGSKKPYAIWGIAAFTTLITVLVWIADASGGAASTKNLMMWAGRTPTARDIETGREINPYTQWGNSEAFDRKLAEHANDKDADEAVVKAYNELEPDQKFYGEFHWYQLITLGFLHEGFFHLAGNMIFMLVFGLRVNALLGNWKTLAVYPVLLFLSSLAFMASEIDRRPGPGLGASGAIMGLAGMYLVLFPLNRLFLVIWLRFLLTGFRLFMKIFAVRGVWVVLFYIAKDLLPIAFGLSDGVAHFAHLGGFGAGVVVALVLLVARQVDANRTDLLSVVLGKNAWQILGKPTSANAAAAA